jgi:hypothetical protein
MAEWQINSVFSVFSVRGRFELSNPDQIAIRKILRQIHLLLAGHIELILTQCLAHTLTTLKDDRVFGWGIDISVYGKINF